MEQTYPALRQIDRTMVKISDILALISGVVVIFLACLLFFDVVTTKAINRNIPHTIEMATNFHVPVVYLTLLAVQLTDGHANVELIYVKFPYMVKKFCVLLWNILGVIICGIETYTSVIYTTDRFTTGALSGINSGFPLWPISAFMVLGWLLMGIGCIWSIIRIVFKLQEIPGVSGEEGAV